MSTHRMQAMLFAAGLLAAGATAQAQRDSVQIDMRWLPYIGCWASSAESRGAGIPGPVVCVAPTTKPETVEFLTVVGDSIVSRAPITVLDEKVARTRDGCTGWETARWSADDRRLYTHAEYTCAGGVTQRQEGMLAMKAGDEFTRVEGVKTRGTTHARIVHFVFLMDSTIVPKEISDRLPSPRSMASYAARMEAAAEMSSADVVDAAKQVDGVLVEALIADRRQAFNVSAHDLRAMKDAGVTEGVIDMVVAVSHPQDFQLAQGGAPMERERMPYSTYGTNDDDNMRRMRNRYLSRQFGYGMWDLGYPSFSDSYFPWYDDTSLYSRYRLAQMFGFGPYFNQYYGYSGSAYFGNSPYNYGGGWVTGTPVTIIPSPPPEPPGRMINGLGYSQGGASSGRGAQPISGSVGNSGWSGGSSGGSGSGGSGSAGSGASSGGSTGGGEQRTAKPRP